jgi:putative membrane protein
MLLRKKVALKILSLYLSHKKGDIWRGALAGAIGGLAGSGIMTLGEMLFSPAQHNGSSGSPQNIKEGEEKEPTAKVAAAITEKALHSAPGPTGEKIGGTLVHFAFGSGVGAVYGAISELTPKTGFWVGAPFGAALWVAADLGALPVIGLSKPPVHIPISKHAQMLGMHLAYGFTTDTVRRYVREAIS